MANTGATDSPHAVTLIDVDALTRTQELFGNGNSVDEVVRELRADGFSIIDSISALIKAGVIYEVAGVAVIDSPVWVDQRDRVTTNRWVDPPERPDQAAVARF